MSARVEALREAAEQIRRSGGYRWVGLYDVGAEEIAVVAWSGEGEPAFPRFPADRGLCGAAAASGETVIVGDVAADPRYLTTFGSTQSELVAPIVAGGRVAGLVDVESEHVDAFGADDRARIEEWARRLAPHWEHPL